MDLIVIPEYLIFFNNRARASRVKSGGIALIVRESMVPILNLDQSKSSKLVFFFTLKTLYIAMIELKI